MNKIVEIEQNSDMPVLKVKMPGINGEILDPKGLSWELKIYTSETRSVDLKYDVNSKQYNNLGVIPTNCDVDGNIIKLYIKSSSVPFSRGQLKARMTLYVPNDNYADGIQLLRTKEKLINIKIV